MATTPKEAVKKEPKAPRPAAHAAGHGAPTAHAPAARVKTTVHPASHHVPAGHTVHAHSATAPKGRYTEAVGRRKTAIARVRIYAGTGKVSVNEKALNVYFTLPRLVSAATAPMDQLKMADVDVSIHVSGGGIHAQADAIRLGLARAIVEKDAAWKPRLRAMGFVTRDSRAVERKKYGKRKARRAPQWAKR
jgi:small subunit ribosomal protein S9